MTQHRDTQRTRREWARCFGDIVGHDLPLVLVTGSRADSIQCPETGVDLCIHENRNGTFSALPPEGSELDSRIDGLTIDDLRLYRLDWSTICLDLAGSLALTGKVRTVPGRPWLWRLGEQRTATHAHPCFLAVIRSDSEAKEVVTALGPIAPARLFVPSLTDAACHELTEAGLAFHVLAEGTPPQFPDGETLRPRPRYLLRQFHGTWELIFDGGRTTIGHEKGLLFVDYLLKNPPPPGAPIHACDLDAQVREVSRGQQGLTEIVDPDTGERVPLSRTSRVVERNLNIDNRQQDRRLWQQRKEWQSVLDDDASTAVEKGEAHEQIAEIDGYLALAVQGTKSNAAKTYDRIRKSLSRLVKHLEGFKDSHGNGNDVYRAFARHLTDHLTAPSSRYSGSRLSRNRAQVAQTFTYEPPAGVVWSD